MDFRNVYKRIGQLADYGIQMKLVEAEDRIYMINQLLDCLLLNEYEEVPNDGPEDADLETILADLLDYACEKGLIEDNITERDLFDTKLMGILVPRPSQVTKRFYNYYGESPKRATDYYYELSKKSDYIRSYRIKKDMKWIASTEYGDMDITINLSKPEKDPKAIAAAKMAKQSGYPICLLCKENVGYAGRLNHPARQNHRVIPVTIQSQTWGFQYSPYVYYNEHCIVFNYEHVPMKIDRNTFAKLFDFVKQFPHYFVGSNADLPIVGGSILSHDHFQGGCYEFAMAKAPIEERFVINGFEEIEVGRVKWPMSVLRLRGNKTERLIELGDKILSKWREYTDESVQIYAYTDGEPHNTITPIARKRGDMYELDLVLRNNLTTKEHPLGVFHPHSELHHIKKENIGLIEVMGLAVLPARLKEEMRLLGEYIVEKKEIRSCEAIAKHADWVEDFSKKYEKISKENVENVLKTEIGIVFMKVLEHAGVYKRDEKGQKAFQKFVEILCK
ncbi:UDP-glucose--hexose-1-phosphate uridylyltransferase [Velocimicrobium porci]|uniref:Galactose-1-phosphate uridylyltransferase n=1 Tax=Velocimicrobium porci TaxID=2606634 RepID=A0A6L5XYR1_9FIRM|nr:UDP-glucose--hexose-1-phosphate uridylyltransferase [Velocimicrobium porci]MSS63601.1 UDP-glucose--hexose-1-phosphate uridylyltransferase [Velocimicrobium porci]